MPRQKLVKKLTVTVTPSGSVIMPHGLVDSAGRGVIPHHVLPGGPTNIGCTSADATNCVFTLAAEALASETADFEVCAYHTIEAITANASTNQTLWAGQSDPNALSAGVGRIINQSSESVIVYINSATGDDANDGLTTSTPLASIAGWQRKFASFIVAPAEMIVSFADDMNQYWNTASPDRTAGPLTYEVDAMFISAISQEFNYGAVSFRGPKMVNAQETGTEYREVASTTVSGSMDQMTVTVTGGVNWSVNALKGKWVEFYGVAEATKFYYELPIVSNTATVLTLDMAAIRATLNTAIGASNLWVRIIQPGARIGAVGANISVTIGGSGGSMNGDVDVYEAKSGATFERLNFRDTVYVGHEFAGVFDRCAFIGLWSYGRIGMINCIVEGNYRHEGSSTVRPEARPDVEADVDPLHINLDTQMQCLVLGVSIKIGLESGTGVLLATRNISVYDATGSGIVVGPGCKYLVASDQSGNPVSTQGSGNTGVGINVGMCGMARVAPLNLNTNITGVGGALKVSSGAAIAYGTGAGQFLEAAGFNGNFTRALEGTAAAPTGDSSIITTRSLTLT